MTTEPIIMSADYIIADALAAVRQGEISPVHKSARQCTQRMRGVNQRGVTAPPNSRMGLRPTGVRTEENSMPPFRVGGSAFSLDDYPQ